jgi:hypothetical protein
MIVQHVITTLSYLTPCLLLIRGDSACNIICPCQLACTSPTVRWFGMIFKGERLIVGSFVYWLRVLGVGERGWKMEDEDDEVVAGEVSGWHDILMRLVGGGVMLLISCRQSWQAFPTSMELCCSSI